jgi:hypothetical protein
MEEYVPPAPFHEERPGRWVAEEAWPSPRIGRRRWHLNVLHLGEKAGPEDRMRVCSPQTTGLSAGDWYGFGAEGESPIDQREDDGKSLVFDSDPVTERMEILGAPVVTLELASNRPVAHVVVRLCDVAPDGASMRVSYGVWNLTQRESREHPTPLEPGRRERVQVQLNDVAYAFDVGHTIRVAISTCYWPVIWPAPEPVTLTIFTGTSTLDLPVRPPREEDALLRAFEPPERGPRSEVTPLEHVPLRRIVQRDLTTDVTVYDVWSDGGDFGGAARARLEDIDLEVGYAIRKTYRIHEHDPNQASTTVHQSTVHRRGDWSTRLELTTELSADPERFRLRATLESWEGDEPFVVRRWDEWIPRQLL